MVPCAGCDRISRSADREGSAAARRAVSRARNRWPQCCRESPMKETTGKEEFLPFTRPSLDDALLTSVANVLRSGWWVSGPRVLEFEAALSRLLGDRPVRALNHATAAMEIALRACGIGPGDEVITPALSFVATANVIVRVGAMPVFVDVDLDTRNLDLDQVEQAIRPRTRALMHARFPG